MQQVEQFQGRRDAGIGAPVCGFAGLAQVAVGGGNRQHAALALEYFCEGGRVAGKAETIVERLRRKKTLR